MHQKRPQVLLRVLLDQLEVVDALAAPRLEDAHAHALDLREPGLDHAGVVGPCFDEDLFGNRSLVTGPAAPARLLRHGRLLIARRTQGQRRAGAFRVVGCVHAEVSGTRRVELLDELREDLGVAALARAFEDEILLAQQLAVANQKHLHAGLTLRPRQRHEVDVDARAPDDLLAFDRAPHRDDAVAQTRRRLEVEVGRRVAHLVL